MSMAPGKSRGRLLSRHAVGLLLGAVALLAIGAAHGQDKNQDDEFTDGPKDAEFHFARLIYEDLQQRGGGFGRGFRRGGRGGGGFGRGWWMQDWPEAETHLRQAVQRLTRIDDGASVTVDLHDGRVFDYPLLYATQVGYWNLGDDEIAMLREYLLRGGFLMTDDFWGDDEWQVFRDAMTRLFPDRPIVEIPGGNDAVLHVLYDIDSFTQIPGLRHLRWGYDPAQGRIPGLPEPHWRGIYDDAGRLMVAINFNQDVGDAWEEADTPAYPEPMTALAYRVAINYIIYAMTH
jgi:Domain of unknown function (DUF4159)